MKRAPVAGTGNSNSRRRRQSYAASGIRKTPRTVTSLKAMAKGRMKLKTAIKIKESYQQLLIKNNG